MTPPLSVHKLIEILKELPNPTLEDVHRIAGWLAKGPVEYGYPYQLKLMLEALGEWLLRVQVTPVNPSSPRSD